MKTAWKNIRRSPYQAFSAILIMSLTFLVISFFTFLLFGSSQIIRHFESIPQVTAFFTNEASQEDISSLQDRLSDTDFVSSVKFVSKEEALEIYKEQNKDDPLLLELVTADVLPASFEISTHNIEDLGKVSEFLDDTEIVSDIIYQRDIISSLTSWTNAIRQIGIVLIILLSAVSIFVMGTIISTKISHKKEDIEIMRLIGAGGWYIRGPFIIESSIYGIIGAVVGWSIAAGILLYSTPYLESFLRGIPVFPINYANLFILLGVEVLFAVFLGVLSSFFAVFRYLK